MQFWDNFQIRNIFYKPYFMLYGEVYADEIDQCGDEGTIDGIGWSVTDIVIIDGTLIDPLTRYEAKIIALPFFTLYEKCMIFFDFLAWDKHSEMNISLYDDQFFEVNSFLY